MFETMTRVDSRGAPEGVSKFCRDFMAVGNLNIEIVDEEILGIIGHNGAGKTTALKILTGLVAPTTWIIEIVGMDIACHGNRIKSQFGYLREESPFYENMTVIKCLMLFSALIPDASRPRATADRRSASFPEAVQRTVQGNEA